MKILLKILFVFLMLSILYAGFIFYEQLPKPTYKLKSPPILLTSIVQAGYEVKWQNNICKLHDKEFYTQRVLKNLDTKRVYPIDVATTISNPPLKKGECRVSNASQIIPINQTPGRYDLVTQIFVKVNNFNTDKFEYTVGEFEITK